MRYIFDILVNFRKNLYDFYDWNKEDEILNIRKIPIVKVSKEDYRAFYFSLVRVSDDFLEKIENKTDVFHRIQFRIIKHACILTDGVQAIAIKFENKENRLVSKLLFEEEEEVLELSEKMKEMNIAYQVLEDKEFLLETRKETKMNAYIKKELQKLSNEKLCYLYFECFNQKNKDRTSILRHFLETQDFTIKKKAYDFLKVISIKK